MHFFSSNKRAVAKKQCKTHYFDEDASKYEATEIHKTNTVDFRCLEVQGTLLNALRYPYFDILDLQKWGKNKSYNHISQIICN